MQILWHILATVLGFATVVEFIPEGKYRSLAIAGFGLLQAIYALHQTPPQNIVKEMN